MEKHLLELESALSNKMIIFPPSTKYSSYDPNFPTVPATAPHLHVLPCSPDVVGVFRSISRNVLNATKPGPTVGPRVLSALATTRWFMHERVSRGTLAGSS